ncbi:MAG TPA: VWA domain-containing protein, partial [Acidimicrobiia bacterium]
DHLVDVLLDVAVSGVNRVEREGVSHTHPARFVLVASMNPEEGELRPQLLDRFGLAVDIEAPTDLTVRSAAVAMQLAADGDPTTLGPYVESDCALRDALTSAVSAAVPTRVMMTASRVAVVVGAEGLRADLMLCRAAAAYAGWEGRTVSTEEDLRRVAPFVLAHRRRRTPFEDPGLSQDELDQAFSQAETNELDRAREDTMTPDDVVDSPVLPSSPSTFATPGRRSPSSGSRGRYVRDIAAGDETVSIAVAPTAVAVAARRAVVPGAPPAPEDLREAVREQRVGNLVVLVVDTSGSMGAQRRIAAAKGVALQLLTDAYQHRDRVALVAFGGNGAEVVLRPTGSVEIARARLADLPVGGTTPLADALDTALAVARGAIRDQQLDPLLVILTDGRATAGSDDPVTAAHEAAGRIASAGVPAVVVDAEAGPARLGLAAELAGVLRSDCVALDDFDAKRLDPYMRRTR